MRVKVLETFDGIAEGKRFVKGRTYDLPDERAGFLIRKGYVEKAAAKTAASDKAVDSE